MRKTSFPHKCSIRGPDWCIAALSRGNKELTGRKWMFQTALFLNGAIEDGRLEATFKAFCDYFPLLWGKPSRCWSPRPCWRHENIPIPGLPVRVGRSSLPEASTHDAIIRHIETLTNRHAARPYWSVALDVIRMGKKGSVLVFSFDHALFDTCSGDSFISFFLGYANGEIDESELAATPAVVKESWADFRHEIESCRQIRHWLRELARIETAQLPLPSDIFHRPFHFETIHFTAEESVQINEKARQYSGSNELAPYLLATTANILRPVFKERAARESLFKVPLAFTNPCQARSAGPVFFNDFSLNYLHFSLAAATDRNALAANLTQQLQQQRSDGLSETIVEASQLLRLLPQSFVWRLIMRMTRKQPASFNFTFLETMAVTRQHLFSTRITEIVHFPIAPLPPGIGLTYGPGLNGSHTVLSYIEGVLSEDQATNLMAELRAALLADCQ